MHRQLRELLHSAEGRSGFVVAVFIDVRGFSTFAKLAESSEAAVFLRSIYSQVMDDYFPDAGFYKPTGDGLLIVLPYDAENVGEIVRFAVETSLRLVQDFPTLTSGDPMVNFPVPSLLGVGLARGATTQLASDDKTLDYSGRPLNLAARLMDLARPSGVVFDASLGADLLDGATLDTLSSDRVYIRGIAESEPLEIFYSAEQTVIAESHKKPLISENWVVQRLPVVPLKELEERGGSFILRLDEKPSDSQSLVVVARHPACVKGRRSETLAATPRFTARLRNEAGVPYAELDCTAIGTKLRESGVKGTWPVNVTIRYLA